MSVNGETSSVSGLDANDHQTAYIFTPSTTEDATERATKRRKVGRTSIPDGTPTESIFKFEPLLNGTESLQCVRLREELFKRSWKKSEEKIQSILGEANEDTLTKVSSFVQETIAVEGPSRIPTGFIATGPNIASQTFLFMQLSERLTTEINGPVVILRSGDASNLKAALKQIIRDATHRKQYDEDSTTTIEHDARKLLNYDLEILYKYVKGHGCYKMVVAFQDSEAFDPTLLGDLITLFNSWMDRIPFVLLFGIATSVELFNERLSRVASRCLNGAQFDVEQTSSILETVFQKVVAGSESSIRMGPELVSSLIERQHDHVQSVQAFTASLKYAYMSHFWANPLSVLSDTTKTSRELLQLLKHEHLEAVRMLPSFRKLVETLLDNQNATHARDLLQNDESLAKEVEESLDSKGTGLHKVIRKMCVLATAVTEPLGKIDLYLKVMKGSLSDSDTVRGVLDTVKRMSPESLLSFLKRIEGVIANGNSELNLEEWTTEESSFLEEINKMDKEISSLAKKSGESGKPIRSSYAAHSQSMRTTVIAQKVHLSYEKSTLSEHDLQFTALIDHFLEVLKEYFTFDNPQHMFLSEVWLYDATLPYKDVFTPRPRYAIERALSTPQDYLGSCDANLDSLSTSKPPTANLYQMYLESGSLINIYDLWTAFFSIVSNEDGVAEGYSERASLMLFYRGLADLKLLGMVKQSKKKVDHLAKSAWNGL